MRSARTTVVCWRSQRSCDRTAACMSMAFLGLVRLRGGLCGLRLSMRETLAQALHQVHDFGRPLFFAGLERDLLALRLRPDDLHQVFAVLIRVFRRIPLGSKAVDERLGHLELLPPNVGLRGKVQV